MIDNSTIVAILGFTLACYSVVGNDVIQTLGTFLSSNGHRSWWQLWLFVSTILVGTLIVGYVDGDISYGRLAKISVPEVLSWWYIIPPIVLIVITRFGLPVSTTFLVLTFFSSNSLAGMLNKSLFGYGVAFFSAFAIYSVITRFTEKKFIDRPLGSDSSLWTNKYFWSTAQWLSTGFLWWQWLQQDLANIYVFLDGGKSLTPLAFAGTIVVLLALLALIFRSHGGKIQKIVNKKTNTEDIRSATIIDLMYGLVLMLFKFNVLHLWEAQLPMSTTWVFLGLLAGREFAIRFRLGMKTSGKVQAMIFSDLGKATLGLIVSVLLVLFLTLLQGGDPSLLFT